MSLSKWSANDAVLLPDHSMSTLTPLSFTESKTETISTLGLQWNPTHDAFSFKVTLSPEATPVTKRTMLSEVARLFDPLAPITVAAKLLIQRLWVKGSDWDQPVDDETFKIWISWRTQLPEVEALNLPRWLGTSNGSSWYIHGFADASTRTYATAVYVTTKRSDGCPISTLLVAKTKVATVKTVSIPRLELCSAILLTRLVKYIKTQLLSEPTAIFCWSDSQVVLAWLSDHPSRWDTFVANRVREILTSLPDAQWQHVKSADNPADLASRETLSAQLLEEGIWWHGTSWLTSRWENWTTPVKVYQTDLEQKTDCLTFATRYATQEKPFEKLMSRFSSLQKFIHVISYVLRWRDKGQGIKYENSLTAVELHRARFTIIRVVQNEHYPEERSRLIAGQYLSRQSPLRRFLPLVDVDGIMRIGGRLQNAYLRAKEKHPAVIPTDSHLSELLIRDAHLRTLHGGPQLVTSYLLRAYWIVRVRNRICRLTHLCVQCTRFNGRVQSQQMTQLPAVRVTSARPFAETGLDYAGPFLPRLQQDVE